jgi:hypothetical protein
VCSAEPAFDAEELDPIRLAGENVTPGVRELDGRRRERARVTERRRRRQPRAAGRRE